MLEMGQSGSEGGVALIPPSLPLSIQPEQTEATPITDYWSLATGHSPLTHLLFNF